MGKPGQFLLDLQTCILSLNSTPCWRFKKKSRSWTSDTHKTNTAYMSKWTLTPFTESPPLFLGAESPVNNHYLLNRLPFPSTECRKGAWRGRNHYLGLFFKDLRNGKQGNQLRKNRKYPHTHNIQAPHHHTRNKAGKCTHIPFIHINCINRKDEKPGVFRIDAYRFSIQWLCSHLTLAHPLSLHKTQAARFLLRGASIHLLRKCALKNDCFSQRREKQ